MDYSIITKAGITRAEAARMVGVSHVIMWKYIMGKAKPREFFQGKPIRARLEMLLRILQKLVDNGSLPKQELRHSPRMEAEKKARREKMVTRIHQLLDERVETKPANQ